MSQQPLCEEEKGHLTSRHYDSCFQLCDLFNDAIFGRGHLNYDAVLNQSALKGVHEINQNDGCWWLLLVGSAVHVYNPST